MGFRPLYLLLVVLVTATARATQPNLSRFVLDEASGNPGKPLVESAFTDPKRMADWGYNGQVVDDQIEGISTFDSVAPGLIPANSKEREWADAHTKTLADKIRAAHLAGVKCYAWMQVLVLPKSVIAKFKDQICDSKGQIDIHLPKTQELFRVQLHEIFEKLPDLDGLVIRTGEVYLYDLPYHTASTSGNGGPLLGSTAILHGPQSHIDLISILRDEVCVHARKMVFYRTWDFGNNFHVNPAYYLQVTDAIEPHPDLIFSIKHQAGVFHRLTPFNPTIGIGKHRQIIEVQCQLEGYGKGACPYYVGQGVIEGWEEYAWMQKPGQAKCLRDVISNPLVAGVWTWSRGGGWDGRIKYAIVEQAWKIMLYGQSGAATRPSDSGKVAAAIIEYGRLWNEWKTLKATNPACSTLPKDLARQPARHGCCDRYRQILANGEKTNTTLPVR